MTSLVLASKSQARADILRQAGVKIEISGSGVDESPIKTEALTKGATPSQVAVILAEAKACALSAQRPGLVIGADQTMEFQGRLFDKAETAVEAREQLAMLRGETHQLHSAVALAENGAVVWRTLQTARLTMRPFSEAYLDGYMARNAALAMACVGGYALEGEGVQLFESIDGDYFTILGLPILALLAELRDRGVVDQ